jgi:hypothetical protein
MWPLDCNVPSRQWPEWQSILTTTDDFENREISAAEIHGIYPKWAYGGGAGRGVEEAF